MESVKGGWWNNKRPELSTFLRLVFGLVWVIDGVMKFVWLGPDDVTSLVTGAGQGQPSWLQPWFTFWINVVASNPGFVLYGVGLLELALGFALLLGLLRKTTYVSGILLSLFIWSIDEGFGGPYGPGSTDIGAAIMYVFVFFALLLLDTMPSSDKYSLDRLIVRRVNGWRRIG